MLDRVRRRESCRAKPTEKVGTLLLRQSLPWLPPLGEAGAVRRLMRVRQACGDASAPHLRCGAPSRLRARSRFGSRCPPDIESQTALRAPRSGEGKKLSLAAWLCPPPLRLSAHLPLKGKDFWRGNVLQHIEIHQKTSPALRQGMPLLGYLWISGLLPKQLPSPP